jgi:phosphatidylserine decarboxylase
VEYRKPGPLQSPGPFAAWASLVGFGARARVPSPLRKPAYRAFARAVGANLGETELDLRAYTSFGDFFARKLRPGARPIDRDDHAIIAPCDGAIAALGVARDGELFQAKGLNYRLEDLVLDEVLARRLENGPYATIYLSPRDYHRVHAPLDARVVGYTYVPGQQWPVNPKYAARIEQLLVRNERVVIWLEAPRIGRIAVVMVAATGVGNIRLAHAPPGRPKAERDNDSVTWRAAGEVRRIELDERVQRGDELGAFRLGSTVVMVFEPGKVKLAGELATSIRFGERLGVVS